MLADLSLIYFSFETEYVINDTTFQQDAVAWGNGGWKWAAAVERVPFGRYLVVGDTREEVLKKLQSPCVQGIPFAYTAPLPVDIEKAPDKSHFLDKTD